MDLILLGYALFAVVLLVGLALYEAYGWRLGGVLVAPLLAIYTLIDYRLLVVFAGAATVSFAIANLARRRWFLYGRRMLALHVLLGLGASLGLLYTLPVSYEGIALPVLPGIFAYNLHREKGLAGPLFRFTAAAAIIFTSIWLALGGSPGTWETAAVGSTAITTGVPSHATDEAAALAASAATFGGAAE